jgi:hypothetical protein
VDEGLLPTRSLKAHGLALAISESQDLRVEHWHTISRECSLIIVGMCCAGGTELSRSHAGEYAGCQHQGVPGLRRNRNIGRGEYQRCRKSDGQGTQTNLGWFVVSTLKEPHRLEGKKTVGSELVRQFDWDLPDVIFSPAGFWADASSVALGPRVPKPLTDHLILEAVYESNGCADDIAVEQIVAATKVMATKGVSSFVPRRLQHSLHFAFS